MKLPTFRIASGFQPANLAACSARAQQAVHEAPPRSSLPRSGWARVLAARRFVHLPLPGSRVAPGKS